jgi:hypothetical protein
VIITGERIMEDKDFTAQLAVDCEPQALFAAICDVHGWWNEAIEGRADTVGADFVHRVADVHRCHVQVQELVPGELVVWRVLENRFSFTEDPSEWTGTRMVFRISRQGDRSRLDFTHEGLVPRFECYPVCQDGWTTYLRSLQSLAETGMGEPHRGEARTASEARLQGASGQPRS